MSDASEMRLQDPCEADLVAALEEASARIGVERHGRAKWRSVLEEIAESDEGRWCLERPARPGARDHRFVFVAWWSDHRGCKHLRIRWGEKWSPRLYPYSTEHDERPALWHVYPNNLYRVKRGKASAEWLVSCACGVTGRPRELAWMGPRCGPCHDRREEGDLLAPAEPPMALGTSYAVVSLEFAPGGEMIAAGLVGRCLSLFPIKGGELVLRGETSTQEDDFSLLTISPDSQWLAVADSLAGEPILWPLEGPLSEVAQAQVVPLDLGSDPGAVIQDMAFAPASDHFAACDDTRRGRLFRWTGSLWAEVRSMRGATALAFSGDGQTLAVGGSGGAVRLLSTDSGGQRGQINAGARSNEDVLFLAWMPDDKALILITGSQNAELHTEEHHLRLWDVARRRETQSSRFGTPSLVALSPDGRYLASVRHDQRHSPAAVHFWDLVAWHDAGWIEWNPEDVVHALAFSPDGQWLAIGTEREGIKLIPWRLLLEE